MSREDIVRALGKGGWHSIEAIAVIIGCSKRAVYASIDAAFQAGDVDVRIIDVRSRDHRTKRKEYALKQEDEQHATH